MSTITARLTKWFSQPQDIVGLATWGGTAAVSVSQYVITHNVSVPVLIGGIVAGFIALVVPAGNTATDVKNLIVDAGTAALAKNVAAIPAVVADAEKVAADVTKPAPSAPAA